MKKFNKFILIRILCVWLIAVSIGIGVFNSYALLSKYNDLSVVEMKDYFSNFIHQNKVIDITKTDSFEDSYYSYMEALWKIIPRGDGSKEAFKKYNTKYNANYLKMNKAVAKQIGISTLTGEPDYSKLYEIIDDGKSLVRLGDHITGHNTIDKNGQKIAFYVIPSSSDDEESTAYYLAENNTIYDNRGIPVGAGEIVQNGDNAEYYYYGDIEDTEEITTSVEITTEANSREKTADKEPVILNFQRANIPEKIKKAAKDKPVVSLCNFYCNGKVYDGYYTINISHDYMKKNYDIYRYFVSDYYSDYPSFQREYKTCEATIKSLPNFHYIVCDGDGAKIEGDIESMKSLEDFKWFVKRSTTDGIISCSDDYPIFRYYFDDYDKFLKSDENYIIGIGFDTELTKQSALSTFAEKYSNWYNDFGVFLIKCLVLLLVTLLCEIGIIAVSGRKSYEEGIHAHTFDGMPSFLRLMVDLILICSSCLGIIAFDSSIFKKYPTFSFVTVIGIWLVALLILDMLSFTTRHVRKHTFLKNTLIGRLTALISKIISKRRAQTEAFRNSAKFIRRRILILAIVNLILFFATVSANHWIVSLILIASFTVIFIGSCVYIAYVLTSINYLQKQTEQLKEGNFEIEINAEEVTSPLRGFAKDLSGLRDSLDSAIEDAKKEQNTKTELITNISHDLKTPLTSIISYVDLLKSTDITDEKALEYIKILGEKSARLKRLIEDLVEASKAVTGNVEVKLETISFGMIFEQLCGEYQDEMTARGLDLVWEMPTEKFNITADSRMLLRVLDNLMNNARKYSAAGSRVYADIERQEENITFTLKNVSAERLNISAEALKERFTRGDKSRNTDGSGLGLSIAENFCNLMNAKLKLEIIGDTFVAKVIFPAI